MAQETLKGIFEGMPGFTALESQGRDIDLTIDRSLWQQGISVEVYTAHEVLIKTDPKTPMEEIIAFLAQHKRFMLNRIRLYQDRRTTEDTIPLLANGDVVKLFGKPYTVERREDVRWARMSDNKILVPLGATRFGELNGDIRRLSYRELKAMTDAYADLYGFSYSSIHINERRTAWGDCDSHKRIGFNVSLAFLPEPLVEYVVVHELAHTREMNHGRNFWLEVRRVLSDYEERREELKRYNLDWYLDRIA